MCFVSLQLKVSRKNLLNVCKLVFKISRNEKNDSLLQNDNILGECHLVPPLSRWDTHLQVTMVRTASLLPNNMQKGRDVYFCSILPCVSHV